MSNSNTSSGDFNPIGHTTYIPSTTKGLDHEAMKIGRGDKMMGLCEHCHCQPGSEINGVKHQECCKCGDRKAVYPILCLGL